MPTSTIDQVPYILEAARAIRPNRVIEVGIGYGKYGLLLREFLYGYQRPDASGSPKVPNLIIDGVEIFPEYVTNLQRAIYDTVFIGDICELTDSLGSYDMALLVDVIEHVEKDRAYPLISALMSKVKLGCLIATPYGEYPQGALHGNPAEAHVSSWTHDDFAATGATVQWMRVGPSLIVYIHHRDQPGISWLHPPRFRRRLNLAMRHVACAFIPNVVRCPRI